MNKFAVLIIFAMLSAFMVEAQPVEAYQLYNHKGKKMKFEKMVKDLSQSDLVFFGEYHDNPISHWLQLELAEALFKIKENNLVIGSEMFENGNQLVLNEYLAGYYDEKKMLPEVTQLWSNYKTDYKPILEFAKSNNLKFIATNIPRRYASMLYKKGIDAMSLLSPQALEMIAPNIEKYFDPQVKCYANMAKNMGGHIPPNLYNIQLAQASKDATMAYFILKNYKKNDLFYHLNGAYHSNEKEGIIWWINKTNPGLTIKNITTLHRSEWDSMTDQEKESIADYCIVVADNMTKTR